MTHVNRLSAHNSVLSNSAARRSCYPCNGHFLDIESGNTPTLTFHYLGPESERASRPADVEIDG
jgi:hypothetical protein